MNGFWPTLPIYIPDTQGIPIWWDIFWWAFQVAIMTGLLVTLRYWAVRLDRETGVSSPAKAEDLTQRGPGVSS